MPRWIGKIVSGLCLLAIVLGILLLLAQRGIHPDQWVADALSWASSPEVLTAITWIIAGIGGLAGLLLWPKIEEFVWSISKPARTPLIDLLAEAEKWGVSFSGHNLDILELAKGLREAAINSAIEIYGRYTRHKSDELNRNEPVVLVPTEHWKTFQIDANTLRRIGVENQERGRAIDNRHITTYNPSQSDWRKGSYFDLYTN